jgi:cytochrome c
MMNKTNIALLILFALACSFQQKEKLRVLVFSKTTGYRHESIGPGKLALIKLGQQNGFEVDTTEDASKFNESNLKRYAAVIFLSTTQNVLDTVQQEDFKKFIEGGGGFVGIHAAADTEYQWPWYGKLVGAYFKSHPKIQEAKLTKVKRFGPNTLPDTWIRTDEWYNYKDISKDINVIYNLDEASYEGGANGKNHPIAWYHEYSGGKSFYTGLGHTNESYADPLFLQHVLQGIRYATGEK